jgi:hypothetical protein
LRAAQIVADAVPGFCLDVVGDGASRPELLALTEELKLGGNVRFLGARNDVNTLLAGADLFVLSSISEGIPMTLLEAQAAGLPAVVTDVGGNREVVIHGETGLLVPPRSPEALAESMLLLLRDPNRARLMGEAGRRRVEALFDARGTAAKYEHRSGSAGDSWPEALSPEWTRTAAFTGSRPSPPHAEVLPPRRPRSCSLRQPCSSVRLPSVASSGDSWTVPRNGCHMLPCFAETKPSIAASRFSIRTTKGYRWTEGLRLEASPEGRALGLGVWVECIQGIRKGMGECGELAPGAVDVFADVNTPGRRWGSISPG